MRHRVYGNKLGRDKDQRTALFKGLVAQLLTYGYIQTSETKAKAIKGLVDKIITLAKSKTSQYKVSSVVQDKALRERLIKEIAPKLQNRTSGYTSLVKMGTRPGDQTMVVKMSLIGIEKMKPIEKVKKVKEEKVEKKETASSEIKSKTRQAVTKIQSAKKGNSRSSKK